jgi:Tfp pilus assembly protein PilX
MVFLAIFSALAVGMAGMADNNMQLADNQHNANMAFAAAQSGLEYGKYLIANANTSAGFQSTGDNTINQTQANDTWTKLCVYVQTHPLTGQTISAATRFTDSGGSGDQLIIPSINYGAANATFTTRFYRYDSDANTVRLATTGADGEATKKIAVGMTIQKSADVLKYAIASKGRVWITGDSTIHGNIYSSWKYQNLSPFNMTSDSTVEGTINTILTKGTTAGHYDDLYAGSSMMPYDLETLDEYGNPMYDNGGNKIISSGDEIQGEYEGINYDINYGEKATNMPGMDLADYDTSTYRNQTTSLSTSGITAVTEYFPHVAGNYGQASSSSSQKVSRYKYENQTFSNKRVSGFSVSSGTLKGTLFKNCTFDGILYVDCGQSGGTYGNVRFENCTFNGPIVTNTPSYPSGDSSTWWKKNQLYFTGEETFQIPQQYQTTILAPNFNVNLGNTNPDTGENNVLTGAIVGGIVDIRGNAEIYGTVISMYDTSGYSSGYVSNIGTTLADGGSETTEAGDIGTINITPNENQLLPSGITTPIVIVPQASSYSEEI